MPRTHGYAPIGWRCYGKHDWGGKVRTNVIGALLGGILIGVTLFTCNIDSDVFHDWVKFSLLPALPPASVVVLDNATFHKRRDTQKLITEVGHILENVTIATLTRVFHALGYEPEIVLHKI